MSSISWDTFNLIHGHCVSVSETVYDTDVASRSEKEAKECPNLLRPKLFHDILFLIKMRATYEDISFNFW